MFMATTVNLNQNDNHQSLVVQRLLMVIDQGALPDTI